MTLTVTMLFPRVGQQRPPSREGRRWRPPSRRLTRRMGLAAAAASQSAARSWPSISAAP